MYCKKNVIYISNYHVIISNHLTVPHLPYNEPLFYKGRKILFVYDNGTIRTVK